MKIFKSLDFIEIYFRYQVNSSGFFSQVNVNIIRDSGLSIYDLNIFKCVDGRISMVFLLSLKNGSNCEDDLSSLSEGTKILPEKGNVSLQSGDIIVLLQFERWSRI